MAVIASGSVGPGKTEVVIDLRREKGPLGITLTPGSGCSVKAQASNNEGLDFDDWDAGSVTARTRRLFQHGDTPTHVKVIHVSGSSDSTYTITD